MGMARMIDADKLVANFRKTKMDEVFPEWKDLGVVAKTAVIRLTTKYRAIILNSPTMEVIRCKECKMEAVCKVAQWLGEDGFCSYGERKDNG